jgi:CBS domain-containing protein
MSFDDAKNNLTTVARYGLHSRLRWLGGRTVAAEKLVLEHLLPLARKGLLAGRVQTSDVDRYLGVLEERVRSGKTGAQWILDSYSAIGDKGKKAERFRSITAAMKRNQEEGQPVSRWELAGFEPMAADPSGFRTVAQVMSSDVFTVHPEDLVDLAANLMDWEHLRYVPVEDQNGHLLGLLSSRAIIRMLARGTPDGGVPVREIMDKDPITIRPEATALEAIQAMRQHEVACLPVVNVEGRLVGIVTEHDFMELSAALLERWLSE